MSDAAAVPPASGVRARRGLIIAVAMGVMNLATYGYTVAVAHLIGKGPFGAFSALMGLLMVVNVLSLGLQATGARRISSDPEHVESVERSVLQVGLRSGLLLGAVCLLAAPLLNSVLRLESLPTALLLGAAALPLAVMGSQAGVLQGERRWNALAGIYLALGLGRFAAGIGFLLVWRSEFAAFLGVALAAWLPVLVGVLVLRRPRSAPSVEPRPGSQVDVIREVAHSSQALLAFFVVSNADVLLARALLPDDVAGLYAGGLILAKAVLFLPQFVVVLAFPSMSSRGATRAVLLKALSLTLGLGLIGVLGALALPDLALLFIGGEDFGEVKGDLWLFAVVGTLLSTIQLLVYSVLARRGWRATVMIWTTLALLVGLARTVETAHGLVLLVVTLESLLLVGLFGAAWLSTPAGASASEDETEPARELRDVIRSEQTGPPNV